VSRSASGCSDERDEYLPDPGVIVSCERTHRRGRARVPTSDPYAGTMARRERALPNALAPAPWPEHPSEDPIGEGARQFVLRLRDALADRSIRSVARDAGLDHVTLLKILAGNAWPDLSTILRLERALERSLFPTWGQEPR
jgi:hypothetical protein